MLRKNLYSMMLSILFLISLILTGCGGSGGGNHNPGGPGGGSNNPGGGNVQIGQNAYIIGNYYNGTTDVGCYWNGNSRVDLNSSAGDASFANSIYVSNRTVLSEAVLITSAVTGPGLPFIQLLRPILSIPFMSLTESLCSR